MAVSQSDVLLLLINSRRLVCHSRLTSAELSHSKLWELPMFQHVSIPPIPYAYIN